LLAFADNEFELSAVQKDGSCLRDHYLSVFDQTGKKPRQLEAYPAPLALIYVWEWFVELSLGRQSSGFGAMPFSWSDIQAWKSLCGYNISSQDIRLLKRLDSIAVKDRTKNARSS
jgi:hypothetical protein